MSEDYDSKLADWMKYVDSQAEAVRHGLPKPEESTGEPKEIISKTPAQQAPEATAEARRQQSIITERTEPVQRQTPPPPARRTSSLSEIISDDTDIPEFEDFLPSLRDPVERPRPSAQQPPAQTPERPPQRIIIPPRPIQQQPKPEEKAPEQDFRLSIPPPAPSPVQEVPDPVVVEPVEVDPKYQSTLFGSEGTGVPKLRTAATPEPEAQAQVEVQQSAAAAQPGMPRVQSTAIPPAVAPKPVEKAPESPKPVAAAPVVQPQPKKPAAPRPVAPPTEISATDAKEMWNKLPKHIQLLLGTQDREIAQKSYKEFRETRGELIHRLLDPPLSLEEAARILNVCPTTVRRYTNRGLLPHFRTAGNQRRFRLSDVLAFLETHFGGSIGEA